MKDTVRFCMETISYTEKEMKNLRETIKLTQKQEFKEITSSIEACYSQNVYHDLIKVNTEQKNRGQFHRNVNPRVKMLFHPTLRCQINAPPRVVSFQFFPTPKTILGSPIY